ncbi:HSP20-like chaperone [Mucidula mucida]|nr:HSP20-like chaperone [Mucidula mucida]
MSIHPEVLWAQRSSTSEPEKNIIYLTVNVPDIVQDSLECNLTSKSISFKAKNVNPDKSDGRTYAFDLDFFSEIDTEHSVKKFTSRSLSFVLRKKELKEEYWPRLTKEKVRNAFLKTDFSKWVDEDEQEGVEVCQEWEAWEECHQAWMVVWEALVLPAPPPTTTTTLMMTVPLLSRMLSPPSRT